MNVNKKVLLLNNSYEPIQIIGGKKALIMLILDKVDLIEKTNSFIRSEKLKLNFPSVIKLKTYVFIKIKNIPLTRKNIINRDNNTCQYCGKKSRSMTIDHVIPKDKNGKDTWSNLVSACSKCNLNKGNNLLSQTNMKLLSKPKKPSHIYHMQKLVSNDNKLWKPYLFMNN
jgi:5-methylcytosine-specific restriction endonuclease McrA